LQALLFLRDSVAQVPNTDPCGVTKVTSSSGGTGG